MTKKKLPVVEQEVSESLLLEEYQMGAWAKLPQWCCKLCSFDTLLGEKPMLEHLANIHNSQAALEILTAPAGGSESEEENNGENPIN